MEKTKIRLLALDLDDTLLDHDHTISKENARALAQAEDAGVHVVLASGRTPRSMDVYAKQLGMDKRGGMLISYNGASVRDCATLHEEWGLRFQADILGEIWDWCKGNNLSFQTYIDDAILVNMQNEYTDLDSKLTSMPNIVVSREKFIEEPRVKCLIPGDPAQLISAMTLLNKKFEGRAVFFTSKPFFLEVMPPGADKGIALERLAGLHGFARQEVMAVGDAMNDLGMIRWAGYGIAMANARPEVKASAHWITTRDNHSSGVAEAVDKFILDLL